MAWPNVNPEFETLFEPTRILLFGKRFRSIKYVPEDMWGNEKQQEVRVAVPGGRGGLPLEGDRPEHQKSKFEEYGNDFKGWPAETRISDEPSPATRERMAANSKEASDKATGAPDANAPTKEAEIEQAVLKAAKEAAEAAREDPDPIPPGRLERKLRRADQSFARIYSFSYEGSYYKMPRPMLFLLSGDGRRPDEDPSNEHIAGRHMAFHTKFAGTEGQYWQFGDDIRVWAVDKKELAVTLDIEIGNYQEVLLNWMAARAGGAARGDMVTRGDMASRGDMSSRGDMASRGAASFRGDMVGPHQNW